MLCDALLACDRDLNDQICWLTTPVSCICNAGMVLRHFIGSASIANVGFTEMLGMCAERAPSNRVTPQIPCRYPILKKAILQDDILELERKF